MADALEATIVDSLRGTSGMSVRVEPVFAGDIQQRVDGDFPGDFPGDFLGVFPAASDTSWLRVWRNHRCLVASRRQSRSPRFAEAVADSAASGWPIAVRRSGGTAVVHRPGVLNISLVSIGSGNPGLRKDYFALLDLIAGALQPLGIAAGHGAVAGAHCDGEYNLAWQGRKLAGTAGFVTRRNGTGLRIFHAALAVSGDLRDDLAAITRFETALGEQPDYTASAHVSVAEILALGVAHHLTRSTGSAPQRAAQTGERR